MGGRQQRQRVHTELVGARLTPEEKARWQRAAAEGGREQLGRWIRETLNGYLAHAGVADADAGAGVAGEVRRPPAAALPADFSPLLVHLGRVGSNLNQIAHRLNLAAIDDAVEPPSLAAIEDAITATHEVLADIREAINTAAPPGPDPR